MRLTAEEVEIKSANNRAARKSQDELLSEIKAIQADGPYERVVITSVAKVTNGRVGKFIPVNPPQPVKKTDAPRS